MKCPECGCILIKTGTVGNRWFECVKCNYKSLQVKCKECDGSGFILQSLIYVEIEG